MNCAHCKNITVCAICGKGYAEAVRADRRCTASAREMLEALVAIERVTRSKGLTDAERKVAIRDIGVTAHCAIQKATGATQ